MPLSFKADSRLLGVYFRNHIFIVHDDLAFPNWSVLIAYALPFLLWQVKDLVRLVLVWYQSLEKSICLVGNPLHVAVHLCMLKAPWNCDTFAGYDSYESVAHGGQNCPRLVPRTECEDQGSGETAA